MSAEPEVRTDDGSAASKVAMRTAVARQRLPQVVLTMWFDGFIGLLCVIARASQIAIHEPGEDLVALNGDYRGHADLQLPTIMRCGPHDGVRRDFRLVDRRHGLRLSRQATLHPREMW